MDEVIVEEVAALIAKDFFGSCVAARSADGRGLVGDGGGLQTASEGFVGALLTSAGVDLLLVSQGGVSVVSSSIHVVWIVSFVSIVARMVYERLWNAHVIQAVLVRYGCVVEPWAVACLPRAGAQHAKVGATTARHVVAALFKLYHGSAVVTALPSLLLGQVDKPLSLWIVGTLAGRMESVVT